MVVVVVVVVVAVVCPNLGRGLHVQVSPVRIFHHQTYPLKKSSMVDKDSQPSNGVSFTFFGLLVQSMQSVLLMIYN